MLWASKRRKSRPDIPPQIKSSSSPARRSSVGSPRLPFAPLQSSDMPPQGPPQNIFIGRSILSPDEQQQLARQSPSPPLNFSLPRRDARNEPSSPSSDDSDTLYKVDTLSSFTFGATAQPPSGRSIGPLDEVDEDDMRRRGADETPRQSLAGTTASNRTASRDPRTPAAHYSPPRSDAASHHTFGTSSASSLSSPSRSGSRSRTTSSTTHTSIDTDGYAGLAGVTFNPVHHHPVLAADVEFDSEEDFGIDDEPYDNDHIEVSSARGGGSIEGPQFEAAFERQMYRDAEAASLAGTRRPSLPMAIPGVAPDMDVHGNRREREGSLATLRRPSRSLDDQVSVLTLGEREGSGGAHGPTPVTVSVPESDGDWRSLSARLNTHAGTSGGGGSASFDGFGFDPDWSAISSGITGLDMSDVAVHSGSSAFGSANPSSWGYRASRDRRPSQLSLMLRRPSTASGGSVMYDPDTFTAAVRQWGGDEYERQRKYWTFRRDHADGRGHTAAGRGGGGSVGAGSAMGRGTSILSGHGGHEKEKGQRPVHTPWRGMALNAEEIWNSSLVGGFKVRRIELRPQKPQQRVTIDPFRGPYRLGPMPPHDGAYTNIHKHSKVMAFSIHRHYKPTRAPPSDPRGAFNASASASAHRPDTSSGANGARGSVSAARRPTAMILLAPRHVQEAYTSTNTTKGLRSHGLLDEGRDRERERGDGRDTRSARDNRDTRSTRSEKGREKEKEKEKGRLNGSKDKSGKSTSSKQQTSSTSSTASFSGPTLTSRSGSSSRRRRRDSMDDPDSDTERVSSRTTHNEAFSTMDASSIDQMVLAQDARYGEGSNGVLSRVLRRAPAHPTGGPAAPHQVYIPPWVTLQSRVKQEERRRRHDVLSHSFEDVGLLPPKKSVGGTRMKKAPIKGVDIFAQVPPDALFMLLPLWPGPTDPVSERNATKEPHEIPTEQRQYLLVSYKPTDERAPPRKNDKEEGRGSKKGSSHSSPTSSADGATGKGCDILLTSYRISARLVSHADLQGSGVRVPDEGLAVLGPWHEAWLTMPQIATRDHGLLVIGTCVSRDAGIEFDPEGLVKMGLCIPVPLEAGAEDLEEEPVAELTPIGKAVLEMAWIGCIAVTSFGPAGSS
ncbi:hypothetical protein DFH08DRAFT_780930 [Mycena albidolilacea]|uniref:Uncharacterized protein n=1 Tax=Mycena albidolilacea TaxID=1033008 RepID=A0AAD7A0I0_9AGAR|nr:hypothetical protein DFH08DRAFT_780930 [Mycena albidolilacea]